MPAPRKWRVGEIVQPRYMDHTGPYSNLNKEANLDALTPRQAGREEFKRQQYQYECVRVASAAKGHGGGSRGSKNGNSNAVRLEARMAEGQLKQGRMPDTQLKPAKVQTQTQSAEVDMQRSMTMDFGALEPREVEDARQEVDIAQLVRPRKMKGRGFASEPVRRAETVADVPLSDFERAIIESLRPEFLPEDGEAEEDVEEDEWEVADASVFSFDLMSVASRDRAIEA